MRKADLETALAIVPDFTEARPELEQVPTPPAVATDLLWAAWQDGWIRDRRVLDLGCGTGMLAHGAAILGAASVVGVDVDERAVKAARRALAGADRDAVEVIVADLHGWHPEPVFETVVMNPPFGAQRKGADRVFYDRAKEAVAVQNGTCWFLAQPRTERFLAAYARDLGAHLERVGDWDYPIRARFAHHRQDVKTFHVGGYRMGWDTEPA